MISRKLFHPVANNELCMDTHGNVPVNPFGATTTTDACTRLTPQCILLKGLSCTHSNCKTWKSLVLSFLVITSAMNCAWDTVVKIFQSTLLELQLLRMLAPDSLQWILIKGFNLYSFQLQDFQTACTVISCHYLCKELCMEHSLKYSSQPYWSCNYCRCLHQTYPPIDPP